MLSHLQRRGVLRCVACGTQPSAGCSDKEKTSKLPPVNITAVDTEFHAPATHLTLQTVLCASRGSGDTFSRTELLPGSSCGCPEQEYRRCCYFSWPFWFFLTVLWHSVASGPNTADVVSRWHHALGTSFLRQKGGMKWVTMKCLMWSSRFCMRFGLVTIVLPEKTLPMHKYTSGLARFVRAVSGSPQHFAETSVYVKPTCVFALRLCTS